MSKLYFRYGAMGSSKTANALMVRYNYEEKGKNAVLLKPMLDNRDGEKVVRSRMGLEYHCEFVEDFLEETRDKKDWSDIDAIIVDEAQFLTSGQVERFSDIVDYGGVPVICYGLRTDFASVLFPGSMRLMELADKIEEIPTVCWCGKRAHFNARIADGRIVREGEQVFIGANESYISLCRRHFKEGKLMRKEENGNGQ
ncbi:MAG: thymidine kinase [Lachnospiraceae bacterium]|nr:thymidine kinase [Lachnospiraceae bacterium]